MYRTIKVEKGNDGWGGPLILKPTGKKHIILNVTGGGISPISKRISELSGADIVDGFKTGIDDESEILVAVVDCGGTARCGVYPKKGIMTVNITPVGQSGPLAQYMKESNYVSGVKNENIQLFEDAPEESYAVNNDDKTDTKAKTYDSQEEKTNILTKIGKGTGKVVGIFYQAGREAIDSVIKNILPFMAFVSLIVGIILKTGIGNWIAKTISPYAGSLPGLLIISIICAIPILSPLLGPGAVIAQIVGVLVGTEIGLGHIPPQYSLPALFAIDAQAGCDFIPVGLSLGEAKPETIEIGVPAVLISRLITGPIAVLIAYAFSIGLYAHR